MSELDAKLNLVLANQLALLEALDVLVWNNEEARKAGARQVTWQRLRSHAALTRQVVRRNTPAEQQDEFKRARLEIDRVPR